MHPNLERIAKVTATPETIRHVTALARAQSDKWPQAGDAIFVYTGDRFALGSCILQRAVLDQPIGPWFSHVAVAVSRRLAIEATTAPEKGEHNWSGVRPGKGVRIQLLPDIIMDSKTCVVLRHPKGRNLEDTIGIHTRYIGLLLGSGYATKAIAAKARKGHAILDALLPQEWFNWKAAPDQIATRLLKKPALREGIRRHLKDGEALLSLNNYFCSELAAMLLATARLLPKTLDQLVTPCGLYDRLKAEGWRDVTEIAYGPETRAEWNAIAKRDWREAFRLDKVFANVSRDDAHATAATGFLSEIVDTFSRRLDAVSQKLAKE